MNKVNNACIELVKRFEGFGLIKNDRYQIYVCPANIFSIGWGRALCHPVTGRHLRSTIPGDKEIADSIFPGGITMKEAEELLHSDLASFSKQVSRLIKVDVNDNEFGAITSFAFNVGSGNLASSTLLKKLNANDKEGTSNEFWKWRRANGEILDGLVRRRKAEKELFLTPVIPSFEEGKYYAQGDYCIYVLNIIGDIVYTVRYSDNHKTYNLEALTQDLYSKYDLEPIEHDFMDDISPTDLI